ncbi:MULTISPECIES: carbohydrate ABC transporter permease [unclassified Meiothermus]|uniref:carbohydrate ABC transporter permease n=1 Tax=unclassified Meiothermus TaxID=370471 RepID=UPI000D7B9ADE|nr:MULTISPECIES: carbohydrate ABC transporter permease [unclassified Meiothermus]PZA06283.1 carbohydrate ABC transporter permease [Meiothermus sp. Pnk-1]RYM36389.1 carbohydrate ABC transporter permease [Meiothermus sp. PNK-Is4]
MNERGGFPTTLHARAEAAGLRRRAAWRKGVGFALTYLILLAILAFAVFPFLWTLAISLTDKKAAGISIYDLPRSLFPPAVTLGNFVEVFEKLKLGKYLLNSLIITGLTVAGTLIVSALAAYPLARLRFPGKNLIFAAILSTLVLPTETSFIVNVLTLNKLHLLGTYWGVVLPTVATAFGIFLMRQAYLAIPGTLLEAARIDGASETQILWRIMIPLSRPSLTALGIFTLVSTWNAYFWPSVALLTNEELLPLSVAILKLKGQFNYDTFNVAAGAVLMMIPVLLVFLLAQRLFMRGLEGAVKG